MKRTRASLGIASLALTLTVVGLGPLRAEDLPTLPTGAPAPDFSARDEDGELHQLVSYRGKAVVLEWTSQDCPYVKRHYDADTMERLASSLGAEGVIWLAVNSSYYNTPEDTRAWKSRQGFEYVTLQDAEGGLGRRYGARTTPHMFVIDAAGVLQYNGAIDDDPRGRSAAPENYVAAAMRAVMAGGTPDPSSTEPYGCGIKYARR